MASAMLDLSNTMDFLYYVRTVLKSCAVECQNEEGKLDRDTLKTKIKEASAVSITGILNYALQLVNTRRLRVTQ